MKKEKKILLLIIIILAFGIRVYKLGSVPPSISWDEAAVGYNSWTIANFGRDEYGKLLPLYFRSFADDKHPVHIYLTAVSVKFLGLNDFSIRLPSAIFGALNVLLIFWLAKMLFKNDLIAVFSALFLAISPYNIHFSRFNHEANFLLFFFMLGLTLFYLSIKKKGIYLPLATLSFAIAFITYHPAKIVLPAISLILLILYFKEIFRNKGLLTSLLILMILAILIFLNPQLLGIARVNQTMQGQKELEKTKIFQQTHNVFLGRLSLILTQYSWHFSPDYLFSSGDKNPRLSSANGEFYKIDALFLAAGLLYLIFKRSKEGLIVLSWGLLAPLPSALVAEAPHAARASLMMGSWHLVSALGLYSLISFFSKYTIKWIIGVVSLAVLTVSLVSYLNYYYGEYAKRYAIEWQYGMKQIVEFVKTYPEYAEVFMTDARSEPYIFFLYYLRVPLPEYLDSVIYNNSESKGYNTVSNFDNFYFGGWDPIESFPTKGVLYIVTPSQYDGLRHKLLFDVKRVIYYPNGLTAFYLVSAKQ